MKARTTLVLGGIAGASMAIAMACSENGEPFVASPAPDAGVVDSGASVPDGGNALDASGDDGAVADAGSGDGGRDLSTNRALFFGPSRCATAGVLFCEDFESGALNTATWTTVGTAPTVDSVQSARGSKALHIVKSGDGASYIREKKTFPALKNTYFGRAFFWFESMPAAPLTYAHWTILAATGTNVAGEIRVGGQFQNGMNRFGVGTDNRGATGTGDWTNSDGDPPGAVPLKQWICVEWMHKGDTNETRFYWDAKEHPSLYTSSTKHGGNTNPYILPTFDTLWIGWDEYQTTTEKFELFVDEIAIDKERIGCVL